MTAMRLGLVLKGINAAHPSPSAYIEMARAAERCGYDAIWAPEIHTTDPYSLLGWIGGNTTSLGLGCAVAQISARTAVATAAASVTLDGLSGGRFRLGLGVSGPQIVEGWHGRPFERPLSYLREYLEVVRIALSGKPICYAGQQITLPLARGAADAALLPFPTPPRQLPIHLAALGPHAVTLAGELADGWIAVHCPPEYMAAARPWLQEGAARSGRLLSSFTTSAAVLCCFDDDEELARDLVRPVLALYIGGMGSRSTNFFNRLAVRLGFADAAATARDAYFSGDIPKAIAAVNDKMVDAMAICGPESHVQARLSAYRDAGVDAVIAGLAVPSLPDQIGQIEAIGSIMSSLRVTERPGDVKRRT